MLIKRVALALKLLQHELQVRHYAAGIGAQCIHLQVNLTVHATLRWW